MGHIFSRKIDLFLSNMLQNSTKANHVRFAAEIEWTFKKTPLSKLRLPLAEKFQRKFLQ